MRFVPSPGNIFLLVGYFIIGTLIISIILNHFFSVQYVPTTIGLIVIGINFSLAATFNLSAARITKRLIKKHGIESEMNPVTRFLLGRFPRYGNIVTILVIMIIGILIGMADLQANQVSVLGFTNSFIWPLVTFLDFNHDRIVEQRDID